MISIARLIASLDGDRVVFDRHGQVITAETPGDVGPATFLVSPVTEAVKRVVGGRVESLDRDQMWAVEGIVLDREVLVRIGHGEMTIEELLDVVDELGYSWGVSPISSP